MTTDWITIWHACWGPLSAERANAIEQYLAGKVEGMKAGELQETIERLADTWDQEKSGRAPNIGLLIWSIKQGRLRARGIDTSEPFEVRQVRMAIQNMPVDDLQRWNAVCLDAIDDAKNEWKTSLARWAVMHGGLLLPWWAPSDIPHTAKQEKPPNAKDWREMARQFAREAKYQHTERKASRPAVAKVARFEEIQGAMPF
jgi:hypothetical protein